MSAKDCIKMGWIYGDGWGGIPSVSGMGMGGTDAGCGASSSKSSGFGAGQEAGCPNSRLAFTVNLGIGLGQRAPAS